MSTSNGTRPAPGTTDLLEVLDRALTGGIVIAAQRRPDVVELARSSDRATVVVAAAEIYLRHPVPDPGLRRAAPVTAPRLRHQPRTRLG